MMLRFYFYTGLFIGLCGSLMAQTRPIGGWRYSDSNQADFSQKTDYPASRVNSGGKQERQLIMGRIQAQPKGQPAKLVVNGVAMPLSVDEGGYYARPYAFGVGSNSLQIHSTTGQPLRRTQFFEANPNKTPAKLRVVLSWDTDQTDVDLHVITPTGEHAWYGNQRLKSGGGIDVDVTTGFGPEIFATPNPQHGLYQIYANYFGGFSSKKAITHTRLTVITDENSPREKQQTFNVPLRQPGELLLVRSFVY